MNIYFATTNPGKIHSLQEDLEKYNISLIQQPIELIEPRSSDVKEIAESKIEQAYSKILKPTIVIDAGFYIDELNGFPRAFVNFTLETIGLEGIIKLTEGKYKGCEFRECLAYMDSKLKEPKYFIAHVRGKIVEKEQGTMQKHLWSKLGLIFIPDGSNKTLGEMTYEEYLGWRKVYRDKNSLGKQLGEWISTRQE